MANYSRVNNNDDDDDKQLAATSNELHNNEDFVYFPEPLNLGQRQLSILEMINNQVTVQRESADDLPDSS